MAVTFRHFFIPAVTQQYLADEIEGPANKVLDKIRNREVISDDEKDQIAKYITIMLIRTPSSKSSYRSSTR